MRNARELRSFILSVVGQLKAGKFVTQKNPTATLDNLVPDSGQNDKFRLTSPFGFISGIPKGVSSFYFGLYGSGFESIILGLLHAKRPEPAGAGETIVYSTDAAGASVQIKIVLGSDGTLTITAPVKVVVNCPDIELGGGTMEKILNGETFQMTFNNHKHLGNLGVPTGIVMDPSAASDLSQTVKAKK